MIYNQFTKQWGEFTSKCTDIQKTEFEAHRWVEGPGGYEYKVYAGSLNIKSEEFEY